MLRPPPLTLLGGGVYMFIFCFYKTGIKPADCQILFYHSTRGLEWETVLCILVKDFNAVESPRLALI